MKTVVHALEARLGGRYRIEMNDGSGTPHIVQGAYTTFSPPHHLAFTWQWEAEESEETLVEITLEPRDAGCDLVLRHSRHSSAAARDSHAAGWEGCLARLTARSATA